MPIAAGSLKPTNPKLVPILLHMVFILLLPLALSPTLLPLGAEFMLVALGWSKGLPIGLVLSVVECVIVAFVYRQVLTWQGGQLAAWEQRILERVTTKAE